MSAELAKYNPNKNNVVVYRSEDGIVSLDVQLLDDTVWLTQQQMADLFQSSRTNIVEHIKHIYDVGELQETATCRNFRQVRKEGNRMVTRKLPCYNLDLIISVGYRVNSVRGVRFRQWANGVIKDYLLNGYAINQRFVDIEERMDRRFFQHELRLNEHQQQIDFFVKASIPPTAQIFFNGEFFEARLFIEKLIKTATSSIILIDAYVDAVTFEMLDARKKGVTADIYSGKDLTILRDRHNMRADAEPVNTHIWSKPSHDRWLIIDKQIYHCGHSLKDMGQNLSAVSLIDSFKAEDLLKQVK